MADLIVTAGSDFSATQATVEPASEAGREFFRAHFGEAVSVTLPKSGLVELGEAMADQGLVLS